MLVKVGFSALRPWHRRFVEEYAKDWNATAAYKRAGYRARGHSADVNASRLRNRPDVAAALAVVLAAQQTAAQMVIDRRAATPIRIRGVGWFDSTGGQFLKS
jgi:phage terminase small subunit